MIYHSNHPEGTKTVGNYFDIGMPSKMNSMPMISGKPEFNDKILPPGIYKRNGKTGYSVQKKLNKKTKYIGHYQELKDAVKALIAFCQEHQITIK